MSRHRSALIVALLTLARLTLAPAARANTSDLEGALDTPLVSTPSMGTESQTVAPATSTVISAEDIRRYGIRSLDEAINFLSLGMMTSDPLHSVDIGARGVLLTSDYGNHVLLLIDGHAMNEQWDGTAYFERGAGIPIELVDHIEVILGPGSVLYGSNAMLGVVNVVTKRAKDYSGVHFIVDGELSPAVDARDALRTPSLSGHYPGDSGRALRVGAGVGTSFELLGHPAELTAQVEYWGYHGPAFTFGPQNYGNDAITGAPKIFGSAQPGTWGGVARSSYYTQIPAGLARLVVGDVEVWLRAETYKRATPYINEFNLNYSTWDSPNDYELDRWIDLDVRHRVQLTKRIGLSSRFYADTYDFQQFNASPAAEDCLPGQNNGCQRSVLGISRWAGLEEQLKIDWLADGRLETLLGVDGRVRYVASKNDVVDRLTGANTEGSFGTYARTDGLLALYVQQMWQPLRALTFNAGVRSDYDDRYGVHLSPRIAAAASLWTGGTLKAIYAEAFRSPTAYEQYYVDPRAQIDAPSLQPETVRSIEATIEQKFGAQRLLFGVFRSWWSNMVLLQDLNDAELAAAKSAGTIVADAPYAQQYRNLATIDNYGLNAAFEGQLLGKLRYGVTFTSAIARRTRPGDPSVGEPATVVEPLTAAPQVFGNARVSYVAGGNWPTLGLTGYFLGPRLADRALDGGFTPTPEAPTQVVLKGTLSGLFPGVTGLSYRFTGTYAFASTTPYVAGPIQAAPPSTPTAAELAPVERLRLSLALEYVVTP